MTAGRSWTRDWASRLISKPKRSAFPLERRCDGQYHVGELGRRIHEHVGMGIEIQRRQGPTCALRLRVGHENVRTKAEQSANGIRLALQDGAIEIEAP